MSEVSPDQLKQAVESQHGGTATLFYVAQVHEIRGSEIVRQRNVHVFDLEGNAKASRAFAWSSPIEGSDKRRIHAVLDQGGIRTPAAAVRAAIVAERQRK
jgi:hypothetical protein